PSSLRSTHVPYTTLFRSLFVAAALAMAAQYGEAWVPHPRAQHLARLVQTNFSQPPSYPADWMELHSAELDELERLSVAASDPRTDRKSTRLNSSHVATPY